MAGNTTENKNAVFNTIKSVFGIIYPLITFPYVSRVLMAENMGKINFGNSIVSYFTLIASLGVTTYAIRECAKVRDDPEQLGKTASQILSVNLLSTVVAYLFLGIALLIAAPLKDYRMLICIQSLSILFTTFGADWLNTAMEDIKSIAVRTMAVQVLSLVLMFVFVREPAHYIRYVVISVIASSGANFLNIFYRRKYCKVKLTLRMDLKKHLPPILLLFSMLLSQTIYCNSDITMLGLMKGDFEVGLYSTAVKIYHLVNTVIASVAWVVMPKLSLGFARQDYSDINRLLKYSLNFIVVLGLPALAGMNIIAPQLIEVLAGPEYLGATTALHILTVSLAFSFLGGWIGNMMMLPSGRESLCLKGCIASAVVNAGLNLILIPKWGLNAAAATTALAELVGVLILAPHINKNIRIHGFMEMIKAPLIGAAGVLVIGACAKAIFQSAFAIVGVTVAASVLFYGATLLLCKNQFVLGFIKPITVKIKGDN